MQIDTDAMPDRRQKSMWG